MQIVITWLIKLVLEYLDCKLTLYTSLVYSISYIGKCSIYSSLAMMLLRGCHGNQFHPKCRQYNQTHMHFKLKRSQSNKWNFKLFQVHATCNSGSVTLIMKHPRDYQGTEKGQKVMYSHGSRCPIPIWMGVLTTPSIFLFTLFTLKG